MLGKFQDEGANLMQVWPQILTFAPYDDDAEGDCVVGDDDEGSDG